VPRAGATEDFLAVRAGGRPYALRLAHIAGLFAGRAVTPLPSSAPALLGAAGFRGNVVAVYDLRVLLAEPADAAPGWLALPAAVPGLALAFDGFEGHFRVARGEATPAPAELIEIAGVIRPIVDVPAVSAGIVDRARARVPRKES
jgi:hypothetical protein